MITKTDYIRAQRCPRMVWLSKNKPDEADNQKQTLLGDYFGKQAKRLFKGVTTVLFSSPKKMADVTETLINRGTKCIAEASFISGDLFCSADIFCIEDRNKKIASVYEVKSTTEYSKYHIEDISFQVYVLTLQGWTISKAVIVTVNSDYKNTGKMDLKSTYSFNDVTDEVNSELLNVPEKVEIAREVMELVEKTTPDLQISSKCNEGFPCPFLKHCLKTVDADVFNIGSIKFNTKVKMYDNGVRTYSDIVNNAKELKISAGAVIQAEAHVNESIHVEKEPIREFIQKFKFPLYFLDFESFQMALPEWENTSAYMQIPFQYSLHKMNSSGKLKHMEFLAEPGKDPRRAIAESLIENIKHKGTILAYNSSFEKTRIRELAALFPDLKDKLLKIEKRIEDLMVPFSKRWIYLPAQKGSYSIKAVLPAIHPNDPRLDYHSLDNVHNGTEAMTEYCRLGSYDEKDREVIINSLLQYCELDTYALVVVYEYLRSIVT